jgi:negative modulator of initiation of replication
MVDLANPSDPSDPSDPSNRTEDTMKTIEINDRIYEFLLRQTKHFGESESDVLERVLNLAPSSNGQNGGGQPNPGTPAGGQTGASSSLKDPVAAFLNSPPFLAQGNAVGRFLSILSWLYSQHVDKFDKILLLNGRKRKYFARTADELDASGSSVKPKQIPNTPYWVVTNSPTQLKKRIIRNVLRLLGYASTQTVVDALR